MITALIFNKGRSLLKDEQITGLFVKLAMPFSYFEAGVIE